MLHCPDTYGADCMCMTFNMTEKMSVHVKHYLGAHFLLLLVTDNGDVAFPQLLLRWDISVLNFNIFQCGFRDCNTINDHS